MDDRFGNVPTVSGQELAVQHEGRKSIATLISEQKPAIMLALGGLTEDERRKRADRFARVALTTIRNSPQLSNANPASLLGALMTSASLNLEIDPRGLAYLVPYKGEVQLQIGYKGMKELAYRTGKVQNIYDEVVYSKEVAAGLVEVSVGLERDLKHKIDITRPELRDGSAKDNPIVLAYAVAVLFDGTKHFEFVDKHEVDKRKKSSQSASGRRPEFSPWNTWEAEMWKKTAVKKLARALPQSTEFAEFHRAVALDEQVDAGVRQSFSTMEGIDINSTPEEGTPADQAPNPQGQAEAPGQEEKPEPLPELRARAKAAVEAAGLSLDDIESSVGASAKSWTRAQCEKAFEIINANTPPEE